MSSSQSRLSAICNTRWSLKYKGCWSLVGIQWWSCIRLFQVPRSWGPEALVKIKGCKWTPALDALLGLNLLAELFNNAHAQAGKNAAHYWKLPLLVRQATSNDQLVTVYCLPAEDEALTAENRPQPECTWGRSKVKHAVIRNTLSHPLQNTCYIRIPYFLLRQ